MIRKIREADAQRMQEESNFGPNDFFPGCGMAEEGAVEIHYLLARLDRMRQTMIEMRAEIEWARMCLPISWRHVETGEYPKEIEQTMERMRAEDVRLRRLLREAYGPELEAEWNEARQR